MSNKYTKKILGIFCHREMQIKTAEILSPVRTAIIRKTTTETGEYEGGKKPYALLMELEMEADTLDTRKEDPQKAKNRTTTIRLCHSWNILTGIQVSMP